MELAATWPVCNFYNTLYEIRWSINWPTSVKPLDHYIVYISCNVIGNWLILTRVEEQTTTYIIIMLLIEAAWSFVGSIVASGKELQSDIKYTPETAHRVCSSLSESRVYSNNPKVSPALVRPAVWPLVRPSDEGLNGLIFQWKSTGVAMCSIRPQNKGGCSYNWL